MKALFITIFLLIGCKEADLLNRIAKGDGPAKKKFEVQEAFRPYVDSFVQSSKFAGTPVTIESLVVKMTDNIETTVLGQCTQKDSYPEVLINSHFWNQLSPEAKEQLIFHELGHCILKRPHRTDKDRRIPVSVMYPYLFSGNWYKANYEQYIFELFTKKDIAHAFPLVETGIDPNYFASSNPELEQDGINSYVMSDDEFSDFHCDGTSVLKE